MNTRRIPIVPLLALLLGACASNAATGSTTPVTSSATEATTETPTTAPATETPTTETPTTETPTTETPTTVPAPTVPAADVVVLAAVAANGSTIDGSIVTPDGRTRTYRVYVPSALPTGPVPLLLAFHGGTGWGAQFERNSGFDGLAEANGFIVVYPDGIGSGADETTNRTWNGGNCCGAAARNEVDDVAFVGQLLDTLEGQYTIDRGRVFAGGHSNGGILSYRLACELSGRIVAVGLQSGTLEIDACAPTTPVSLLHIHGTADTNLPIDGGRGATSIANVDFNSPRVAARAFAIADGCAAEPTATTDATNPDLAISSWTGCGGGTEVRFVAVADATHPWMGHTPSNPAAPAAYQGIDSSYEIVEYLLRHPRTAS